MKVTYIYRKMITFLTSHHNDAQLGLVLIVTLIVAIGSGAIGAFDTPLAQPRDVGLATCEKIYGLLAYPRITQNITVLRTSPLRVRVHLLAQGPSTSIPFSVEGMVCPNGFDQNAANAACRSQNFNNAVLVPNIEWQPPFGTGAGQECIMDTGSYKSVIPCEYILHRLNCLPAATNLAQCTFPPLFTPSAACNRYTHIGLICTWMR